MDGVGATVLKTRQGEYPRKRIRQLRIIRPTEPKNTYRRGAMNKESRR